MYFIYIFYNKLFILAIAEVYKIEGNNEYGRKEFSNAVYFYTEGIKVNCKDDELNARLYSNRATAYFYSGELLLIIDFYRLNF